VSKRRPLTRPVEDHEESEGRERWLISYADFITLLMAFFVVMYSISSVNTGKFRVLSNSLESMLAPVPNRPVPVDLGGGATPRDGCPIGLCPLTLAVARRRVTAFLMRHATSPQLTSLRAVMP
jgi:hypothetical protein